MAKKPGTIASPKTRPQYNKLIKVGSRHYEKGNFPEALRYFTRSLDFKDYHPDILVFMARCLFHLGMKNKAIAILEHALDQSAGNPEICETLGNACVTMDLNELAIKFYTIYCQLNPGSSIGYNNLATALRENGQVDESIQLLQDMIPIYPEDPLLWNTVAAAISYRDGFPAALPFYEEAYRLDPTVLSISNNLCLTYTNLGQYEKAWELAQKAVKISESAISHRSLVHCSYRIANFEDAFKSLAWHNHPSEPGSVFMPYNIEKWQGQDLKGKTILIGAEQGVGDEILFSAPYPDLIKEAKHVIIGCDQRLVPLFTNSFKEATILPYVAAEHEAGYKIRLYEGINEQKIDYMCLYTELMRYKWQSLDDISDMSDGFLTPSQEKVDYWQEKLTHLPHKINIGLCWKSGIKQTKRSMLYAELLEWAPVLKTKNVNFINVQYGDCDAEIKALLDVHGIVLHDFKDLNLKDDFEGTAALMKNLDLVIGTGSSPLPQAATVGTLAWWIVYNARPWWNFGLELNTPIFRKAKMTIKPPTLDWEGFMPLLAEEEFVPWVEEKLKKNAKNSI
ncbi:MAG: tetratricopeptide repeat protein [Emcibacter sp.]|nr:tetratricopeptide repeat protein [Emcibacter sp.]